MTRITDKTLGTVCRDVTDADRIDIIINDMFETTQEGDGVGLAANQIGSDLRIVVVDYRGRQTVMINPVIVKKWGGVQEGEEGCLSFPGKRVKVKRYKRVRVTGLDGERNPFRATYSGYAARIIQHEIDHLDGVTMFKRARVGPFG